MDINIDKLPKSALSLYVKLYCKRKGETNTKYQNNLIEATKSWLSLSEQEKQQFMDKLEECRENFKYRFADYLKNVEPYLKKKPVKRISTPHQVTENTQIVLHETTKNDNHMNIHDDIFLDENKTNVEITENSWLETFTESEVLQHKDDIPEEESRTNPLPEPIPPNVKSANELFNMVNTNHDNEKTWTTLSSLEKQRYRNAVLNLKKNYIVQYKAYLESLPSKELFEYYNKVIEP